MLKIDNSSWDLKAIQAILDGNKIEIADAVIQAVQDNRSYLEEKIVRSPKPIYGINTGFGSLCDIEISSEDLSELQLNLVRSHACGTGPEVPVEIIRIIQALKIKNASLAHSGIRVELLNQMLDLYNHEIVPEMFQQGSLGASGDLAPLAHMALSLLGEGQVYLNGEKMDAQAALDQKGLKGMGLQAKEGLALLNGTQFSTAYLSYACLHAQRLYKLANMITALSYEAYDCNLDPLDARIHTVRNQAGQQDAAEQIRKYLDGGNLLAKNQYIQDPYAFRCAPQVHGASKDTIDYVSEIACREINAVTDNPLVFSETDDIMSGGNFHAQPIALAADFLAIALAELGSISERRTYNLIDGKRELPSYLVQEQGLHSGFMIAQYTAAAIVSENKQLCTPASIDSIPSSKGQEDHVSMAANAGRKLYTIVDNLYQLLAIEMLIACQAMDFRTERKLPAALKPYYDALRARSSFVEQDIILGKSLRETKDWLKSSFDF